MVSSISVPSLDHSGHHISPYQMPLGHHKQRRASQILLAESRAAGHHDENGDAADGGGPGGGIVPRAKSLGQAGFEAMAASDGVATASGFGAKQGVSSSSAGGASPGAGGGKVMRQLVVFLANNKVADMAVDAAMAVAM